MDKDEVFNMKYSLIINDIISIIKEDYEDNPNKYIIKNLKFNEIYDSVYELIKENSNDYVEIEEESSTDDELDFID